MTSQAIHFIQGPVLDCTSLVTSHLEHHVGPVESRFSIGMGGHLNAREIDVALIAASEERPFHTICTVGMSNITMNAPGAKLSHIELMMCLPYDWNFNAFDQQWPVLWLRNLAWYVYTAKTWLGMDHTIPAGGPVGPGIPMTGMLISVPILTPVRFAEGLNANDKHVMFMSVIPIFEEEMNFILKHGADTIYDRFQRHGVSELFDPHRKNVCLS